MNPVDPSSTRAPAGRRPWLLPGAILAGGVLAWVLAAVVVFATARDADQDSERDAPDLLPTVIAAKPTRAAPTLAPLPSSTPSATATETPGATPSVTPSVTPSPTGTDAPTGTPTATPIATLTQTPTDTPAEALAEIISAAPAVAVSATPPPTPTSRAGVEPDAAGDPPTTAPGAPVGVAGALTACAPPEGWEAYTVQQDDTLFAFALGAGNTVTVDDLIAANCLTSRYLSVGQQLYLPPGAAENAPPSVPAAAAGVTGARGPRTPNCPCTIVIPAGWRLEQVAAAVDAASTLFTGADFLAAAGPGAQAPFDFTQERPPGASLEGFLYPGAYTAQNDTTAEAFRDMLLSAFAANVGPSVRADAAAKGISFYQALIIASIVQRESRAPETQKLVASIFFNRLRDGNRLASTVPVSYALGGPGNWWPRVTGSNMEVDSPYNTYTRPGLPPTPINSPDINAILGTVYAPETDYYYMAGGCGRGAMFARTYEEHLANIRCE